jgi:hypothetical protein
MNKPTEQQLNDRYRRLQLARRELQGTLDRLSSSIYDKDKLKELRDDLLIPLARINPLYFPEVNGEVGLRMQQAATVRESIRMPGVGELVCRWIRLQRLSFDEANEELINCWLNDNQHLTIQNLA